MLIAGDVGGTKTRLAIYEEGGRPIPQHETVYTSDKFAHLEDIVDQFIHETGATITRAVFGLPGPVIQGTVQVTNLPWTVNVQDMQSALDVDDVILLNDLEATAYAIPFLPESDLHVLHEGQDIPEGNKVVVAPGTGLGEAILFHHKGQYIASPTEGGHTDFAPRNLFEINLLQYLMGKFGHVSYERICSGIGIPQIYEYIAHSTYEKENPQVQERLNAAEDKTPIIVQAALDKESTLCGETLEAFVRILGNEAGNMALNVLAKGGVYLGGGIPPRILPSLQDGTFISAFVDKGRFSEMLQNIPVYVILNDKAALYGAAVYALGWCEV
ncbi:MAG: glucokinase [Anaerolineales bacterium]